MPHVWESPSSPDLKQTFRWGTSYQELVGKEPVSLFCRFPPTFRSLVHQQDQADATHNCSSNLSREDTGWYRLGLVHPESLEGLLGQKSPIRDDSYLTEMLHHNVRQPQEVSVQGSCCCHGLSPARRESCVPPSPFLCCPRGVQQVRNCNGRHGSMAEPDLSPSAEAVFVKAEQTSWFARLGDLAAPGTFSLSTTAKEAWERIMLYLGYLATSQRCHSQKNHPNT